MLHMNSVIFTMPTVLKSIVILAPVATKI